MEELDYEDVLLIHPDEDIKKMESIEIDANSNLEEVIEIDVHSNLEEVIDIDVHSNLEEAIEIDTNSNLEEAVEIDVNSNLKKFIEADSISNLDGASETGVISNLDHASDSGEIDDDEEANDLEEGEIKESGALLKKKSEIACRFFKRGSCVFGSQCQYLHVSDTVYKMFDTNPQKRNDLQPVVHQNFMKPIIFPSNVLPPRPFIEPPVSGTPKVEFHRQYDTIEDNWEKGLEQARILIQKKANLKKRNDDNEPNKFNSKTNKSEQTKGEHFTKTNIGSELLYSNSKKYCDKPLSNNSLRRVDSFDGKKSNYRYQPRSNDKWVDPWRRSKSPESKSRHRSPSSSPLSRARKRSYASSISSSSSSSEFDAIYERSYKKKSPVGRRASKSRSNSQPKKQRLSPKHSINGRKNSLPSSRSFSRSPKRKRKSRSLSRSSSSSSLSSCSEYETNLTAEDKEFRRISAKLNEQLYHKSPKRGSPSLHSDCETSELTVSSASCTSISSDSESDSPHHSPLRNKQSPIQNNFSSYSNRFKGPANTKVFIKKEPAKSRDVIQHKDDVVTSVQKKMLPSNRDKNQNNWGFKTESTGCKPKNAASSFNSVKKPNTEVSKSKKSHDMNLLFMYQDLTSSNRNKNNIPNKTKVKLNNSAIKPNKTGAAVKEANKANSEKQNKISKVPTHDMDMLCMYQELGNDNKNSNNIQNPKTNSPALKSSKTDNVLCTSKTDSYSESGQKISKVSNVPRHNIVLNLQPKSKSYTKPEMFSKPQADETVTIKKKVSMSKREQLLNKLKLIDDAIARKKNK